MAKKIVIIGSGFGGLAEAIRLQARGYQVTILEKQSMPGGHAFQLKKNGYTFDMGPSLITAPSIIQRVFEAAGKKMEDYLDLVKLDPFYRIYFHDGRYIDYTDDADSMKAQMGAFHPEDALAYDKFMEASKGIYNAVIRDGLGSTPFMDWGTFASFVPRALKLKALLPAHTFVSRYFKHPHNRFTFSFHPLFIGGSPFRAPAIYLMIPYLEKEEGVWFSRGGMYSLVEAFVKVFEELGGEIRTDTEVEEILVTRGRTHGVTAKGERFEADAVVSNADWVHTNTNLIAPQHRARWTDKKVIGKDYSMSAFLLYLGTKKQYPQLKHHTLILSHRYKALVRDIFDRKVLPDDFSMYLHVPTRTDSSMAPEGSESMYVLIPVTNLQGSVDWSVKTKPFTERILNFLEHDFGMDGLQDNLEVLETFTPDDFRRYRNNYLGSAWGVEPKLLQTANFRPHNRHNDISNLYFVGTSTHPGAGVPGVLLTAETTEKVLIGDMGASGNGWKPGG